MKEADAQVIDFETFPAGGSTGDMEEISNQYMQSAGVSFAIVDSEEKFVRYPLIAKVGPPLTAFYGCPGEDQPLPGQGVGQSFLTDDDQLGYTGSLLVTYADPVVEASGVILDVDIHSTGQFEEWTVIARNAAGATVDFDVISAPVGPAYSCSAGGFLGPGDSLAFQWTLRSPAMIAEIQSILIEFTGNATAVGLAFDNFSPSSVGAAATSYGCEVNPVGSLTVLAGSSSVGDVVVFGVDNPFGTQSVGSLPLVLLSLAADAAFPCGTQFPGLGMAGAGAPGEVLIDLGSANLVKPFLFNALWAGPGSPAPVLAAFPEAPELVGLKVYAQGVILDQSPSSAVPIGLTNGMAIVVGG
ncbi:hypothetical protein [Engelhardtia mirabilis]|uniref:hypothetical protein n=1 Tax=Engelhardtia mirabilis TaxID=2528011 RepID=UPI0011A755B7